MSDMVESTPFEYCREEPTEGQASHRLRLAACALLQDFAEELLRFRVHLIPQRLPRFRRDVRCRCNRGSDESAFFSASTSAACIESTSRRSDMRASNATLLFGTSSASLKKRPKSSSGRGLRAELLQRLPTFLGGLGFRINLLERRHSVVEFLQAPITLVGRSLRLLLLFVFRRVVSRSNRPGREQGERQADRKISCSTHLRALFGCDLISSSNRGPSGSTPARILSVSDAPTIVTDCFIGFRDVRKSRGAGR